MANNFNNKFPRIKRHDIIRIHMQYMIENTLKETQSHENIICIISILNTKQHNEWILDLKFSTFNTVLNYYINI